MSYKFELNTKIPLVKIYYPEPLPKAKYNPLLSFYKKDTIIFSFILFDCNNKPIDLTDEEIYFTLYIRNTECILYTVNSIDNQIINENLSKGYITIRIDNNDLTIGDHRYELMLKNKTTLIQNIVHKDYLSIKA